MGRPCSGPRCWNETFENWAWLLCCPQQKKTKKSRDDRRNGIKATNFRGLKLKCYEVKTQKEKASRGFWELNRIETTNEPLERELKRFNGEFNRFTFLIFPSVVLPTTFAMSITTNKSNKTNTTMKKQLSKLHLKTDSIVVLSKNDTLAIKGGAPAVKTLSCQVGRCWPNG